MKITQTTTPSPAINYQKINIKIPQLPNGNYIFNTCDDSNLYWNNSNIKDFYGNNAINLVSTPSYFYISKNNDNTQVLPNTYTISNNSGQYLYVNSNINSSNVYWDNGPPTSSNYNFYINNNNVPNYYFIFISKFSNRPVGTFGNSTLYVPSKDPNSGIIKSNGPNTGFGNAMSYSSYYYKNMSYILERNSNFKLSVYAITDIKVIDSSLWGTTYKNSDDWFTISSNVPSIPNSLNTPIDLNHQIGGQTLYLIIKYSIVYPGTDDNTPVLTNLALEHFSGYSPICPGFQISNTGVKNPKNLETGLTNISLTGQGYGLFSGNPGTNSSCWDMGACVTFTPINNCTTFISSIMINQTNSGVNPNLNQTINYLDANNINITINLNQCENVIDAHTNCGDGSYYYLVYGLNSVYNNTIPTSSTLNNPFSSTSYNSKLWSTIVSSSPLNISFPELCTSNNYLKNIPDINKVSIAISGGGSRSFTCMMGYFRALNRMGYKNKAQYVSTVSGGSWFYGLYSYCQSNPSYTDVSLLGSSSGLNSDGIPQPSNMTLSKLKSDNSNNNLYFGNIFVKKDLFDHLVDELLSTSVKMEDVWNNTIGKMILEPYGLNNNVPVALNYSHANDLISRNSAIGNPLYFPDGMPFWICNTALLFNYVTQYPYIVVPLTPLYSGIPQIISENNNSIGGYLVENYAFGNTNFPEGSLLPLASNDCSTTKTITLQKSSNIKTLKDMIGTSSSFYASVAYNPSLTSTVLASLLPSNVIDLIPKYNIWGTSPVIKTTSDSQCTYSLFHNNCKVPEGYDVNTCTKVGTECYSNTAPQCTNNNQCTWSYSQAQCVNTNSDNSSLSCVYSPSILHPLGCSCKPVQPNTSNQDSKNVLYSEKTHLGDGGFSDNSGVLSLLARGVKRIISFANDQDKIINYSSTTCQSLPSLFGVANTSCASLYPDSNSKQVFNSSDYTNIIFPQLQTTLNSGGPTYARASLQVLPNKIYGIAGGYTVDILFILLQPSSIFNNQLPKEIQNQITSIPLTSLSIQGDFNNFPNYLTSFQNLNLGGVSLTLSQINLLSSYTEWCLNQQPLKGIIQQMYSY